MLEKVMQKTAGIFTATVVIVAGLVAMPTVANANETPQQPVQPPTSVTLTVDAVTTTDATLKATLDQPLEDSNSTLSLYKDGVPITQQTANIGNETLFTVPRPTIVEYEQYYVEVGSLRSNQVTVDSPTATWNLSISAQDGKTQFATGEVPTINWEANQVLENTNKFIYFINSNDGNIIRRASSGQQGSDTVETSITGGPVEYHLTVADGDWSAQNESQLTNISTKSNSIFFSRKPWTIELSVDTPIFSTDDPSPIITWSTNQKVLPYYNIGNFSVFFADVDTNEIVHTVYSTYQSNLGTYETRFYNGAAKNYVAYVAEFDYRKVYSTVADLTNIQATSNTINIERKAWNLTIDIDQAEFSTDSETPKITWETNQTLQGSSKNYALFVAEKETGEIFTVIYYDAAGETAIPRFYDGNEKEYIAYVAKAPTYNVGYSNISQLQDIQATSNTISTSRVAWEVIADINSENFTTDEETPKVTWQANQTLSGTKGAYRVYLVDDSTGIIQNHDGAGGNSSGPGMTGELEIQRFYTGEARTYKIYIARGNYGYNEPFPVDVSGLEDIQAISNSVSTQRATWTVDIQIDNEIFYTDDVTPKITWSTNQSIRQQGDYGVYLADIGTGKIIGRGTTPASWVPGSTGEIAIERFYTGDMRSYKAYVAKNITNKTIENVSDLEDVQAISGTVTTQRQPWALSINIDRTIFSTDDPSPRITWQTNQPINGSAYNYLVYLVDMYTDEIIGVSSKPYYNDVLDVGTFDFRFESGPQRFYRAYVAKGSNTFDPNAVTPTHLSDLEDIQAKSEVVVTKRAKWNIALTITEAVPYNFEDEDSENDEIEYTLVWATNQTVDKHEYNTYIFNGNYRAFSNVSQNWTGAMSYAKVRLPATVQSNFVAYVAKKETYGQYFSNANLLEDIQAVSTHVSPQETSQEILNQRYMGGGNPSEGNCNQQCYGDPVNSYNGEFFENETDLAISSAIPFSFARSYSTTGLGEVGAFGDGWTFNYNMSLKSENNLALTDSQRITVVQENNSIVKFSQGVSNGEDVYVSPSNVLADLEHDATNDKFLFKRRGTNQTYIFNASSGILEKVIDTNNNYLNFTYTNDKLTQVANNEGKTLTINWSNNRIISISDGSRTVTYSYSTDNNLNIVNFSDIEGDKQYIYDTTTNRITGIVHPGGAAYHNEYNSEGQVIKQTDPLAAETLFTYLENETTVTLPDGTVNKEIYNKTGQLIEKKLAVGTSLETSYTYSYDFTGQVSAEYGPDGLIISYTHDYYGNTLSARNALYQTFSYSYNSNNQVVEITNPLWQKSINTYDDKGNLIENETFGGAITKYDVNSNGSNKSIQSPIDVVLDNNKKLLFGYDTNGHLNSATTADNAELTVINDELGNPIKVTDALGEVTSYVYNAYKQLVSVETPNGATTETEYDNAGRVISETDVLGRETSYTYDLMNKITSKTTVLGTTEYEYDINGRLIKTIGIDNTETIYEYDELGRTVSVIDPNGNETTNTYYDNSRLESTTDSLGNTTTYEYDVVGNLIKTIDSADNETVASYDNLNRIISTTSSNGYTETYQYDNENRLISVTKAGLETTNYEYDLNGNLIKTIYPDSSTEDRTYDSNNSLISVKDRDGKITSYEYNIGGQLIKTIRPDLTEESYSYTNMGQLDNVTYDNWVTVDTKYIYDIAGRITNSFKNGVETTYSYDAIGNLTRRGPPSSPGVEYDYNQYGELTKLTYPSGVKLSYTYDNNSNLLTVNHDNETLAEYTYDANDNNTRVDYGNGSYEEYDYDELNRLSQFTINNQSGELYNKQLERNSVGFIIGSQTNVNTSTVENKAYSYTNVQRLENVTNNITNDTNTYTFDTSSNLTNSQLGTNTFSAQGQLDSNITGNVAASYSYDLRGNRTAAQFVDAISTNETKNISYSWSNDNKLTNYTKTAVEVESDKTTTDVTDIDYTYDTYGLLTGKIRSHESTIVQPEGDSSDNVVSADSYKWNTLSSVPTLLEDNQNNYVYGLGSAPFAQIKKNAAGILAGIEYLHTDERGSIIAATTDDGDLSWTRLYDEYGSVFEEEPEVGTEQIETPFAYAGEYLDSDTGLYNLRARWYEPSTASFISVDLALLSTGEGYSYASANPLTNTDPLGLMTQADSQRVFTSSLGALTDIVTIGISSKISNAIRPGSVNTCTPAYKVASNLGNALATFVPVGKGLEGIGALAAVAFGVIKLDKAGDGFNAGKSLLVTQKIENIPTHTIWRGDTPQIAAFTEKMWAAGAPKTVTYGKYTAPVKAANRRERTKHLATQSGKQRDEYPYTSVIEGNLKDSPDGVMGAELVDSIENAQQAADLRRLTANMGRGDKFNVIIKEGHRPDSSTYIRALKEKLYGRIQ